MTSRRMRWMMAATGALCLVSGAWAQTPTLDPALRPLAEREAPAVLETLRALTAVDSGTGQAEGLRAVTDHIDGMARALGGTVERVAPDKGIAGPILVITFKGTGRRKIMLMSHLDTVYPAGTAAARPFRIEGNKAIAPGIADDKSGPAVFLHAMKMLKERGFSDYERVTMVFNTDEERASVGSRDLIRRQAQAHDVVLSGEPTWETESIVLATSSAGYVSARVRTGGFGTPDGRSVEELAELVLRTREVQQQVPETRLNWTVMRAQDPDGLHRLSAGEHQFATLRFAVRGRASHAGTAPELGVNAVLEISALVQRVSEAARRMAGAQLHWRVAGGGAVSNMIPEATQAIAELALPKGAAMADALSALGAAGQKVLLPQATVTVETSDGLPEKLAGPADALATADVRAPSQAAFTQIAQAARTLAERKRFNSSSVSVQEGMVFPPYAATEEGRQLAQQAQALYAQLGGQLVLAPRTYGGTDAAWAGQSGKPVVENLGLPGGNYHSSGDEFILIDRIPNRLLLAAEMIRAVSAR